MPDIAGEVTALGEYLTTNGVRATTDPRRVNVPAVWLEFAGTEADTLSGGLTTLVNAHLCVADSGYTSALEALTALYNAVNDLVDLYGPITPEVVVLPDASNVPAWQVQAKLTTDT